MQSPLAAAAPQSPNGLSQALSSFSNILGPTALSNAPAPAIGSFAALFSGRR